MADVSWLGAGYPPDPNAAKRTEVKDLLVELGVLGKDGDHVERGKTPESLQVITAGSTAISRWWARLAAAGLGGSALITGLRTFKWWPGDENISDAQQIALTLSAALLAASAAIAIAIIVRGDVMGRATASAAEYAARASITTALVKAFTYAGPAPVTQAAAPQHVVLRSSTNTWHLVREFSYVGGVVTAVVSDTLSIPASDIDEVIHLPSDAS